MRRGRNCVPCDIFRTGSVKNGRMHPGQKRVGPRDSTEGSDNSMQRIVISCGALLKNQLLGCSWRKTSRFREFPERRWQLTADTRDLHRGKTFQCSASDFVIVS